jgi:PAS domain S-box-containing protein
MDLAVSPLTMLWSVCAGACSMLGLMSLTLWLRRRSEIAYLLAAVMAAAAACSALIELFLALSTDLGTYRTLLFVQVPVGAAIALALTWFVYFHFGSASRALAFGISLLWLVHVAVNFASTDTAVFATITSLERIAMPWGEVISVARGAAHPWRFVAAWATALIVFYLLDASIRVWRRGEHQKAAVVGGAAASFIVLAGIQSHLVDERLIHAPYMISFAFLAVVAAMMYQLVDEALAAARYARELESREKRWLTLLDRLPLLVVTRDVDACIQYANPAMTEVCGYTPTELAGMHFTEVVPQTELGKVTNRFQQAWQDEISRPDTIPLKAKNGTIREVIWTAVPLKDATDRLVGTLSIGVDVSHEIRTRNALEQARREMDRLARATLLGEVAAGLAHELNQPLTAILSNSQAARRMLASAAPDLEELREILDDIVSDDKRAGEVIHGLRAMLQTEGSGDRSVTLERVVRRALELLSSELSSQGIRLRLELDDAGTIVRGEEIQIQQVVMNLVLNAVRAMSDTEPARREITVAATVGDHHLVVSVADRGTGISGETQTRMFEPFVTTRLGGLGMGLAICRRIVQRYGGRIWAENRLDGGAIVSFSLPLASGKTEGAAA